MTKRGGERAFRSQETRFVDLERGLFGDGESEAAAKAEHTARMRQESKVEFMPAFLRSKDRREGEKFVLQSLVPGLPSVNCCNGDQTCYEAFVAAPACSGPTASGRTFAAAPASGLSKVFSRATVPAPPDAAVRLRATRSGLAPDCEMARNAATFMRSPPSNRPPSEGSSDASGIPVPIPVRSLKKGV